MVVEGAEGRNSEVRLELCDEASNVLDNGVDVLKTIQNPAWGFNMGGNPAPAGMGLCLSRFRQIPDIGCELKIPGCVFNFAFQALANCNSQNPLEQRPNVSVQIKAVDSVDDLMPYPGLFPGIAYFP